MGGLTNEEANEEEISLIAWGRAKGLNLTNSANGGAGPVNHFAGRKLTEAEKQHLREINTGKKQSPETVAKRILKGEKHWTFGKPRIEETRKKISASLSGEKHPNWGLSRAGSGAGAKRNDNSSGFVGVSWKTGKLKWESYINFDGKRKFLGYFKSAEEAARAYDETAVKIYGESAKVNFPNNRKGVEKST